MKPVVTGRSVLTSRETGPELDKLIGRLKQVRFVHDLELLTVVSVGKLLDEAGIIYPAGNPGLSIYIGIDDAVEDIKDEYFNNILKEGMMGASPLLFPYTSPNALAAQASIAFDIRGESITVSVKDFCRDVIKYAVDCIVQGYTIMAVAGLISISPDDAYSAEFLLIENRNSALRRGAKIYSYNGDWMNEYFRFD
ncbi:MAG: hypothetical protein C4526_09470 [Nitrospiraceae bacterium]|nr:MAG: hypothetical protein C4526_09470 [Nitrospiraceae bacterium]